MIHAVGEDGTFWMYAFFGLCALGFFYSRVPETKQRSLEQIERDIRGDSAGPEEMSA